MRPFSLATTPIGDAATTFATASAASRIFLICVHDAKVYM
jgi:hypothetical protein